MTITKPPKNPDHFTESAPDGKRERFKRWNKVQISHLMTEKMLDEVDAARKDLGNMSRSNWINMAIAEKIKRDRQD